MKNFEFLQFMYFVLQIVCNGRVCAKREKHMKGSGDKNPLLLKPAYVPSQKEFAVAVI
jgi:hypothetical protein